MTETQITQNNSLIAVFMGNNFIESIGYHFYCTENIVAGSDTNSFLAVMEFGYNEGYMIWPEQLLYHCEWNWMIPVINKIVDSNKWRVELLGYKSNVSRSLPSKNLGVIYSDVINFILIYNRQMK